MFLIHKQMRHFVSIEGIIWIANGWTLKPTIIPTLDIIRCRPRSYVLNIPIYIWLEHFVNFCLFQEFSKLLDSRWFFAKWGKNKFSYYVVFIVINQLRLLPNPRI